MMESLIFSMLIFSIVWIACGIFFWLKSFIEFYNVQFLRPGLIQLPIFMILGPFPLLMFFVKNK